VQLCRFNVTTGGFTVVLKGLPGRNLECITTRVPFMVLRYAVTGGISSTIGSQSLVPSSTSLLAKLTRLSSLTTRQSLRSFFSSLTAHWSIWTNRSTEHLRRSKTDSALLS